MLALPEWLQQISVAAKSKASRRADRYGGITTGGSFRGDKQSTIPEPKPTKYVALVQSHQRAALVEVIARYLRQWQSSPWQYEAPARKILRNYLIKQGHPWALSDLEADKIVQAALAKNGNAVRPSWDDGQPELTRVAGLCMQCGGDIKHRNGVAASAFFCEPIPPTISCESRYNLYREDTFRAWMTNEGKAVAKEAFKDRLGVRCCDGCGTEYRPNSRGQRFCTKLCGLTHDKRPDVPCAHCSAIFRPQVRNGKASIYCSKSCAGKAKTKAVDLTCLQCGSGFAGMPGRLFCGNACYQASRSSKASAFRSDPA
jgi:hypothetical protein